MKSENKPYTCVEATMDITAGIGMIRLWIDITLPESREEYKPEVITASIRDFLFESQNVTKQEIIEFVAATVPHINAVQVIEKEGPVKLGEVAYTTAFETDIHG